jgi:DNA-binding MarR family transcriptional regulator
MTHSSETKSFEFNQCLPGNGVGELISRVSSLIGKKITQRTVVELGVTGQQASALFMVASGKSVLANDLAREYGVDASAMARLIDRLEKRNLMTRGRDSMDRRAVRLALSPEGCDIAARMPAIATNVQEELLSVLTAEEIGFLKSLLRRIQINSGVL